MIEDGVLRSKVDAILALHVDRKQSAFPVKTGCDCKFGNSSAAVTRWILHYRQMRHGSQPDLCVDPIVIHSGGDSDPDIVIGNSPFSLA